jgi:gamma-butyrobetaine dioxygenase
VRHDPSYHDQLSEASKYTLGLQGGPMSAPEAATYEALPHAADAVRLRRWDDLAKDATHEPPPFEYFLPVLRGLAG